MEIIDTTGKTIDTIDMKNKMYDKIMDEFLSKVEHKVIPEDELIQV